MNVGSHWQSTSSFKCEDKTGFDVFSEPRPSRVTLWKAPALICGSLCPLEIFYQNLHRMWPSVHTSLFARWNAWAHVDTFPLSACCQNCCGTPSTTPLKGSHQAGGDKQTDCCHPADKQEHTCVHAHTQAHTLSQQWEVGFEAVTNCPAGWGYPWRAPLLRCLMPFS